tara:strand:- start:200 stop:418 length:219 start_codon:yes stop_codon:yes gene_type:complete
MSTLLERVNEQIIRYNRSTKRDFDYDRLIETLSIVHSLVHKATESFQDDETTDEGIQCIKSMKTILNQTFDF